MALNRTKTLALTAAIAMGAVIASSSFAEARRYCPRTHSSWHYGWHYGWYKGHRPLYSRYYYRPAVYAGWYRYPGWYRTGWYGPYYGYGYGPGYGGGLLGAGASVVGAGVGAGTGLLGAGLFGIL